MLRPCEDEPNIVMVRSLLGWLRNRLVAEQCTAVQVRQEHGIRPVALAVRLVASPASTAEKTFVQDEFNLDVEKGSCYMLAYLLSAGHRHASQSRPAHSLVEDTG